MKNDVPVMIHHFDYFYKYFRGSTIFPSNIAAATVAGEARKISDLALPSGLENSGYWWQSLSHHPIQSRRS